MLQSYAAAAVSEEAHVDSSAHTCGLFLEVLVVLLCDVPELSCGPRRDRARWMFRFRCWDLLLGDAAPLAAAESVSALTQQPSGNRSERLRAASTAALLK